MAVNNWKKSMADRKLIDVIREAGGADGAAKIEVRMRRQGFVTECAEAELPFLQSFDEVVES